MAGVVRGAMEVPSINSTRVQRANRSNNIEQVRLKHKLNLMEKEIVHNIRVANNDIRMIALTLDYISSSSGYSPEGVPPDYVEPEEKEEVGPCYLYGERLTSRRFGKFRRLKSAASPVPMQRVGSSDSLHSVNSAPTEITYDNRPRTSPEDSRGRVFSTTNKSATFLTGSSTPHTPHRLAFEEISEENHDDIARENIENNNQRLHSSGDRNGRSSARMDHSQAALQSSGNNNTLSAQKAASHGNRNTISALKMESNTSLLERPKETNRISSASHKSLTKREKVEEPRSPVRSGSDPDPFGGSTFHTSEIRPLLGRSSSAAAGMSMYRSKYVSDHKRYNSEYNNNYIDINTPPSNGYSNNNIRENDSNPKSASYYTELSKARKEKLASLNAELSQTRVQTNMTNQYRKHAIGGGWGVVPPPPPPSKEREKHENLKKIRININETRQKQLEERMQAFKESTKPRRPVNNLLDDGMDPVSLV